ncbi:unnamed protein product [Echinostoma caproni]|uniref:PDZ domain-containing protein n=1 Tax=Echinostoma caproni TaxID=27848 RepID=A0A183B5Z2_9TREM|nr:unnamed protein product [Echinostoma caproni]
MTYNASICPTDHATPDPCDISPRMRPRLGTMIGPGPGAGPGPGPIQKPQPWRPVRSEQPQTTGVGLQHVTQRRRERLLDWPQFRLRRKFTSTTENGVKRWNADSLSETGPHRHPMKAIHPGLSSDCSQCPTIITGSVATGINAAVRVQSNKTETVETSGTRRRRGISTNPHVRRRFSADGMPLHGDDLTGFRVTRVSDSQMDTSPGLKELHVGDELIQVNGMQCARLSLMELTQHFSKCLILLLTVRSITTEPQRS